MVFRLRIENLYIFAEKFQMLWLLNLQLEISFLSMKKGQ